MEYSILNPDLLPEELSLKHIWENSTSRNLESPCERDLVDDVLKAAFRRTESYKAYFSENIDEFTFISDDLDTAFVRHNRYTPAFWHTHQFFELLYVLKGCCVNTIFDRAVTMEPGDICLIAPGVRHAVAAFSDDDILLNILIRKSTFENSYKALMDGDDILSDFFTRVFYNTNEIPYLLFRTKSDPILLNYTERAFAEFNNNNRYRRQMLNAIFSEFFIELFRRHEKDIAIPNIQHNAKETNLIFILRYMQSHYTTLTLKELAQFFNYSERQLQRIIQKATGMSFKENIQKQQMVHAADLLANSSLSISSIGEQTGFQSFNNFRKIFYKHYQTTPSQYRKNAGSQT